MFNPLTSTLQVQFYDSFSGHAKVDDVTEAALRALSQVQGSFAFVVYDHVRRRVWAARDAGGVQPLYWGVTGGALPAAAGGRGCACLWVKTCVLRLVFALGCVLLQCVVVGVAVLGVEHNTTPG